MSRASDPEPVELLVLRLAAYRRTKEAARALRAAPPRFFRGNAVLRARPDDPQGRLFT